MCFSPILWKPDHTFGVEPYCKSNPPVDHTSYLTCFEGVVVIPNMNALRRTRKHPNNLAQGTQTRNTGKSKGGGKISLVQRTATTPSKEVLKVCHPRKRIKPFEEGQRCIRLGQRLKTKKEQDYDFIG
jgi:hypothetical protein